MFEQSSHPRSRKNTRLSDAEPERTRRDPPNSWKGCPSPCMAASFGPAPGKVKSPCHNHTLTLALPPHQGPGAMQNQPPPSRCTHVGTVYHTHVVAESARLLPTATSLLSSLLHTPCSAETPHYSPSYRHAPSPPPPSFWSTRVSPLCSDLLRPHRLVASSMSSGCCV